MRANDLRGMRVGKLVVQARCGSDEYGKAMFECLCDCGGMVVLRGQHLLTGKVKTCGCRGRGFIAGTRMPADVMTA